MRTRLLVAAGAMLFLCTGIPSAQEPAKPAADAKTAAKKTEDVSLDHADVTRSEWGKGNKVYLKGHVKFHHGDTVLTSDEIEYDQDTQIAVSPGKVTITDPECDITGDKGTAYFNKRIGVVEGNVIMLVKPKKPEEDGASKKEGSSESLRAKLSKPTTVTCPKLEYNYRSKVASATGGVLMKQEKRTANAKKLIYDDKKELLTLLGDIRAVDENGQTFSAPDKVTISIKKGAEWMEAPNASGTFKVRTEEEKPE